MIPLTDTLVRVAIVTLAVAALLCIGIVAWAYEADQRYDYTAAARRAADSDLRGGGGPAGLIFVAPLLCIALFLVTKGALEQAERPMVRVGVGTLVLMGLSILLFIIKVYRVVLYAVLEFLFAATVAVHTLWKMNDVIAPIEVLALISAVYLMIRSMDNFTKGTEVIGIRSHRKNTGANTPDSVRPI